MQNEKSEVPSFILEIDGQINKIINLTNIEISLELDEKKYVKVEDKERKIAIFNLAVQSWEDYDLVLKTTHVPIPLFQTYNLIEKNRTRQYSPQEYVDILLKNFDEPWYVYIDSSWMLLGGEGIPDFSTPHINIIPESRLAEWKQQHQMHVERVKSLYKEVLSQTESTIKNLQEGQVVEGNFVLTSSGSSTRSDKYQLMTQIYGLLSKGIFVPSVFVEEHKILRDGVYNLKGVWRKVDKFYKLPLGLNKYEMFLEIREAHQIKDLQMKEEIWQNKPLVTDFKWDKKKYVSLFLNTIKEKTRSALFRIKDNLQHLIVSFILLAVLIAFVFGLWQGVSFVFKILP